MFSLQNVELVEIFISTMLTNRKRIYNVKYFVLGSDAEGAIGKDNTKDQF